MATPEERMREPSYQLITALLQGTPGHVKYTEDMNQVIRWVRDIENDPTIPEYVKEEWTRKPKKNINKWKETLAKSLLGGVDDILKLVTPPPREDTEEYQSQRVMFRTAMGKAIASYVNNSYSWTSDQDLGIPQEIINLYPEQYRDFPDNCQDFRVHHVYPVEDQLALTPYLWSALVWQFENGQINQNSNQPIYPVEPTYPEPVPGGVPSTETFPIQTDQSEKKKPGFFKKHAGWIVAGALALAGVFGLAKAANSNNKGQLSVHKTDNATHIRVVGDTKQAVRTTQDIEEISKSLNRMRLDDSDTSLKVHQNNNEKKLSDNEVIRDSSKTRRQVTEDRNAEILNTRQTQFQVNQYGLLEFTGTVQAITGAAHDVMGVLEHGSRLGRHGGSHHHGNPPPPNFRGNPPPSRGNPPPPPPRGPKGNPPPRHFHNPNVPHGGHGH